MDKGLVIVLSGFSGAGKGTIMKHLISKYGDLYNLSISATTRDIRPGEEEGREYFFKSREEFDRMVEAGEFLEHATFNGNSYGTLKSYVDSISEQGKDIILEIEVQGALQVKEIYPDALLLFVTAPSGEELKNRLVGRGSEDCENIKQRLSISVRESGLMEKYDYLIINDEIGDAVETVHGIIQAEHYKIDRNKNLIVDIQKDLKDFDC